MKNRLDSNNASRRDSSYQKPAQDVDEPIVTENDDVHENQKELVGDGRASSATFQIPLDDDSDKEEKFQTEEKNAAEEEVKEEAKQIESESDEEVQPPKPLVVQHVGRYQLR